MTDNIETVVAEVLDALRDHADDVALQRRRERGRERVRRFRERRRAAHEAQEPTRNMKEN